MSNKQEIIDNFIILASYYRQQGDRFRYIAYQNASMALRNLDTSHITEVPKVPGIGKQTQTKIKEYLDTGHIAKADEVRQLILSDHSEVVALFSTVMGVGPKQAQKFYNGGMRTIEDLRLNPQLLNRTQLLGLKYYRDLHQRIPREYIYIFQLMCRIVLIQELGQDSFMMEVAGSYRRGTNDSGDIDFLITSEEVTLPQIVDILTRRGIIVENISGATTGEKFMGIVHCPGGGMFHYHLDIVFLPREEWAAGLLYFTGNRDFNIAMRAKAKRLGYHLDQHGLWLGGGKLPLTTEADFMKTLNMPWVPPTKRI